MPEFSMKPSSQHDRQQERLVMESGDMARAVTRIAHEILERNKGVKDLGLVGIRTGGVHLAHRLVRRIHDIEGVTVPDRRVRHYPLSRRLGLAEGTADPSQDVRAI